MMLVAVIVVVVLAASPGGLGKEGDACHHRKLRRDGTCQTLSRCPSASGPSGASGARQQCPFRRGDSAPTVCCTGVSNASSVADAVADKPSTSTSTRTSNAATSAAPDQDTALPCYRLLEQAKDDDVSAPLPRGPPGTIAKEMCRRYARYVCARKRVSYPFAGVALEDYCESQKKTDQLIIGGREARPKEYPHMAMLGYGPRGDIKYLCGGTLVAPRFVLTAAHCLYSGADPVQWVVVGARSRTEAPHAGGRPQLVRVAERIKHPDYKPPLKYNDIALLRLDGEAALEEGFARPACLSTEPAVEQRHKAAIATGWGLTEWDGDQSELLMTVTMNLTSLADCQKAYGSRNGGIPDGILDKHLCAGSPGKDSCEGDSGGPLQIFPSEPYCMFHVVGVVSFGQFCGFRTPGVYTRVHSYLAWIESTVWPQNKTSKIPRTPPVVRARRRDREDQWGPPSYL